MSISSNDKDLIKQMMKMPGWDLLKNHVEEQTKGFMLLAEQPEVDEHYRLILFGKSIGVKEFYTISQSVIE